MSQIEKPVLFSESSVGEAAIGVITLHRPSALNSLNTHCYNLIEAKLFAWAKNPQIAAIIIEGHGDKAFCAGGDVKTLALEINKNNIDAAKDFFTQEYFVDYFIHKYPKPVVAFADGITMGGGLGLINGASHRIVTEKTIVAMPEVAIGLFPDVGATHFLATRPENFGYFMGLTGARISAGDAIRAGLADYYMESKFKRKIYADLLRLPWSGDAHLDRNTISEYLKTALPEKPAALNFNDYLNWQELFDSTNYFNIFEKLFSAEFTTDFMQTAKNRFLAGSPTAKQVFFEACQRHKKLNIRDVFIAEWEMAIGFSKEREFHEGVRAVLIDKDNQPQWNPTNEYEVSHTNRFFETNEKNLLAQKISDLSSKSTFFNS